MYECMNVWMYECMYICNIRYVISKYNSLQLSEIPKKAVVFVVFVASCNSCSISFCCSLGPRLWCSCTMRTAWKWNWHININIINNIITYYTHKHPAGPETVPHKTHVFFKKLWFYHSAVLIWWLEILEKLGARFLAFQRHRCNACVATCHVVSDPRDLSSVATCNVVNDPRDLSSMAIYHVRSTRNVNMPPTPPHPNPH